MSLFSADKTTAEDGHINVLGDFIAKPEHAAAIEAMLMDSVRSRLATS